MIPAGRTKHGLHPPLRRGQRDARNELEALHATALEVLARGDLDEVLRALVTGVAGLVGTSDGFLYVQHDEDEERFIIRVGTGSFQTKLGYGVHRGEDVAGRVWLSGKPVVVDDYPSWSNGRPHFETAAVHAVAAVPLTIDGGTVGVLGLSCAKDGRPFGDSEISLLGRFARLAALALENAQVRATVQDELLDRHRAEEELLDAVARLERSQQELQHAHAEMVRRLASAAEFRDDDTGRHIERMGRYCEFLARKLGLDDARCELLRAASPLHDVGKIAIPDHVLLKPGPLTADERQLMERHAEVGYRLLSGSSSEVLELAATIAWTHHERFDGTGYPRGLAGAAIPLEGRIAAVADVFEALTSDRVYRPAFGRGDALELMRDGRGTQFDPVVLDVLVESVEELTAEPAEDGLERHLERIGLRSRTEEAGGSFPLDRMARAARAARAALEDTPDDRAAIELMVTRLREEAGHALLVAVYVVDHERLWCAVQQGYKEARDGFTIGRGVLGRALRSGEPQLVEDVTLDADFIGAHGEAFSELALPFGDGEGARGVLNLESALVLPYDAVELFVPLLQPLTRRLTALQRNVGPETETLLRLCVHASSLRGVEKIADFATRTIGRLLELEMVQLDLVVDGAYRLASFWRRDDASTSPLQPADLVSLERHWQPDHAAFSILEIDGGTNLVWLPLRAPGGYVGLVAGATRGEVSHARVEAATLFAQHVAALLDGATALRREERAAVTDVRTGMLNRRGFERRLRDELHQAKRAGHELSVVLIECEGLKCAYDHGGHAAGEAVLDRVANCLRGVKRSGDVAARLGDAEFGVLLPQTTATAARKLAESFRQRVAADPVPTDGTIGVSFGVATYCEEAADAQTLLGAAAKARARARSSGRGDAPVLAA